MTSSSNRCAWSMMRPWWLVAAGTLEVTSVAAQPAAPTSSSGTSSAPTSSGHPAQPAPPAAAVSPSGAPVASAASARPPAPPAPSAPSTEAVEPSPSPPPTAPEATSDSNGAAPVLPVVAPTPSPAQPGPSASVASDEPSGGVSKHPVLKPSTPEPLANESTAVLDGADLPEPSSFRTPTGDTPQTTVDRRDRDMQLVPASVVVISGVELERKGVTSIRELPALTPYVEIGDQHGNIEIYTRGLGDSDDGGLGDTSIAAYVDGVYIPRARGFRPAFFDAERIEIALGPQTTLRGRNAFAGTIHLVNKTAKLGEWSADGSAQLGNYNQRLMRGTVNIPVGDRLALRLALFSERHDSFYDNEGGATLLRAAEDADRLSYRISGRWEPADNVAVTLRFDNSKDTDTGVVGSNYTQALLSGIEPSEIPDARAAAFVGNQPSRAIDHWGVSANIEVDLGQVGLEVLTSFRKLTYDQHSGNNRTYFHGARAPELDSYSDTVWNTRSESSLNEIRVFSSDASRLRWMLGFFHFSEAQSIFLGQVDDPATHGRLGRELNLNDVPSGSLAGYVDTTTDITDAFRTIAGFRITSEYRRRRGVGGGFTLGCNVEALERARTSDPNAECLAPNDTFDGGVRWGTPGFAFSQGGRTDYTQGSSSDSLEGVKSRVETFRDGVASWGSRDTVERYLEQPGADVGTDFVEQRGQLSSLLPDFRLGGEWDIGQQSLVYLMFTSAHRRGGFNEVVTLEPRQAEDSASYDPATLYATELGSKNAFLDKRLLFNGAAFWYAQSETQAATVREVGTVWRSNVGQSRVLGLSVDATGYLLYGFSARLSAAALDARYVGASIQLPLLTSESTREVDIGGNFLPRAPRLALAYGVAQAIPSAIGEFDWSVSAQTKSPMYMTPFNGENAEANPLSNDVAPWSTRIDAAIGYTRSEGDIRLDAFVANLTNATYLTSLLASPTTNLRFFNPPRQFGLRVSMSL